ncbi:glycosyltransferase [Trinickia sp.]|uniref:glycosyltransferase n=1 Tax=Trinickia sp. TaxID=2571163 RepID=UPI003F802896
MIDELCVIGHPSHLGGADTELDHQIWCWQAMGITVHVCHTWPVDDNCLAMKLEERGCVYHSFRDWRSLEGLHCISFCNGEFLECLEQIRKWARTTTFVNCMTYNFEGELRCQERGLIDFHLYQTDLGRERVGKRLAEFSQPYRPMMVVPYFRATEFPFHEKRADGKFSFGRISRADTDKFHAQQLWIYDTMTAPELKEGHIVGWNDCIRDKLGREPDDYVHTYAERGITQQDFYASCDAVIMSTDTFENLPRVAFEAMASGSVLVVDRRGGWTKVVEDGVTGWLCQDPSEFVYKASRCAFEKAEREQMRHAARDRLERIAGFAAASRSWASVFEAWQKLR